ncbi:MAG: ketoacyl-ACP synthase III [Alphaproteobacteria bacterium]|nr:ketoacyl-ACP synthase III [Alphaproteobacteria bacterium]PHX98271.1 MAG: 3-oxoacyl-ACP synthase [Rhodospirillaceae bacterium]
MIVRSVILGVGAYLPANIVSNAELSKRVDTTDEWITERTGIKQRHVAAEGQFTSHLAIEAGRAAMEMAGIKSSELDLLIVATTTPDNTFPATAAKVQAVIGRPGIPAFDIQAVCSGFVYSLAVADNFIKTSQVKTALVIGAETLSRFLDWTDRSSCVLFGDGAGAVVLQAAEGQGTSADRGVLSTHLHSDGRYADILYADGGVSSTQTTGLLRMKGKEVFRHAVVNLADTAREAVEANGVTFADVDWLVPHQANSRILDSTAEKLGLSADKVIVTVDKHANTSAASIPLALHQGVTDGRIKRGQLLLMETMGGGFTWGSALVRF